MNRSVLICIDAVVNLLLGLLLIVFPYDVAKFVGVPNVDSAFYPSILGAVLFGIGVALVLEFVKSPFRGLGLAGAVSINMLGGAVLACWLLLGELKIPLRGYVFLWTLVALLFGLSGVELLSLRTKPK